MSTSEPAETTLHQSDRVILEHALAEPEGGTGRDLIVLQDASGELTARSLDAAAARPGARVIGWSASHRLTAGLRERFSTQIAAGSLVLPAAEGEPTPLVDHLAAATSAASAPAAGAPTAAADAAADATTSPDGGAATPAGGDLLALMRLPKGLRELEARARELAVHALDTGAELELVAGGRVKHMSRSQNDSLAKAFAEVAATRGIGKSRALAACGPRPGTHLLAPARGAARLRVRGQQREIPLRGIGGVFGSASADAGSVLLLETLDAGIASLGNVERAIDLGGGNGLMTAYLAAAFPDAQVLASDDDADAVASTRLTLAAAGLARDGVSVRWDDALSQEESASADLLVLNPPFHDGTAVDATLVQELLDAAARVLRRGGQLWMVHNSHLRYRPELERRVGRVQQAARDRRFTVLVATRA